MSEKVNDERMISEIIQYYNDYDGTLEESMFNWLINRVIELKYHDEIYVVFNNSGLIGLEYFKTKNEVDDFINYLNEKTKINHYYYRVFKEFSSK